MNACARFVMSSVGLGDSTPTSGRPYTRVPLRVSVYPRGQAGDARADSSHNIDECVLTT